LRGSGVLTPAALSLDEGSTDPARTIRPGVVELAAAAAAAASFGLLDSSWPGGNGGALSGSPRVDRRKATGSDSSVEAADEGRTTSAK